MAARMAPIKSRTAACAAGTSNDRPAEVRKKRRVSGKERKRFFFEKNQQITFVYYGLAHLPRQIP
jgi:hypothetical protein